MPGGARGSTVDQIKALFGANLRALYITNLENVTLNGSNVSGLADLSGNGYHLSQSTAVDQPLWEVAGWNSNKGSIVLNDSGDRLVNDGSALGALASGDDTPLTLLVLAQLTATTDTNSTLAGWVNTGATDRYAFVRGQASGVVPFFPRVHDGTAPAQLITAGSPDTTRHTYAWIRHGATSSTYLDTTLLDNGATMDVGNIVGTNRFAIGGVGAVGFSGTVARHRMCVVVDRAITAQEHADWRAIAVADSGGL